MTGRLPCIVLALCAAMAGSAAPAQGSDSDSTRRAPFDALKNIPLSADGSVSVDLGGQWRVRPELSRHPVFGLAGPDHHDGLLIRTLLSADVHAGPHVRAFVELGSGLAPAWNGTPPATQHDDLDLVQGYGELTVPAGRGSLMVRAGRQQMSFGSSRLVSVRESPNIRRAFDGVRAAWVPSPDIRIDAFFVHPVVPRTGVFDDKADAAQSFWGLYATGPVPGLSALKIDAYYLGLSHDGARYAQGMADERRHTLGARLFGKAADVDWNVEAAYQFGHFGRVDIRAWTVSADLGYTPAGLPLAPRLGLKADVISGDRNPHDGTLATFNPLFPKLPYFSEANLAAPANLVDLQPNLTVAPARNVTLTSGWNPLWKYAQADAFYGPTMTPLPATAGGPDRYIGQQISTAFAW